MSPPALICPECRGELEAVGTKTATCAAHDGRYEILFDRFAGMATAVAAAPAVVTDATTFEAPSPMAPSAPTSMAPTLAATVLAEPTVAAPSPPSPATTEPMPREPTLETLMPQASASEAATSIEPSLTSPVPSESEVSFCAQHPEVAAVVLCRLCSAGVCETCDFHLPGDMHVCPSCIDKQPDEEVSPKRRRRLIWGIALGVYSTIALLLMLTGTLYRMLLSVDGQQAIGAVVAYFIFIPIIIGTAMSWSAFDRRLKNPMSIWLPAIWNSALLAFYCVLIVIGLLKK